MSQDEQYEYDDISSPYSYLYSSCTVSREASQVDDVYEYDTDDNYDNIVTLALKQEVDDEDIISVTASCKTIAGYPWKDHPVLSIIKNTSCEVIELVSRHEFSYEGEGKVIPFLRTGISSSDSYSIVKWDELCRHIFNSDEVVKEKLSEYFSNMKSGSMQVVQVSFEDTQCCICFSHTAELIHFECYKDSSLERLCSVASLDKVSTFHNDHRSTLLYLSQSFYEPSIYQKESSHQSYTTHAMHAACRSCWQNYVHSFDGTANKSPLQITCMHSKCKTVLGLKDIIFKLFDSNDEVGKKSFFCAVERSFVSENSHYIYCTNPSCCSLLRVKAEKKSLKGEELKCPDCNVGFSPFCTCHQQHFFLSCEEFGYTLF